MSEIQRLKEITARLRAPGGCEWDRAQDFRSMRRYLLEETHELLHAIESEDCENLIEELGDVLFHVFFFAQLGSEEQDPQRRFDLEDVAAGIADKLVRRHPHVFGETEVDGVGEILRNWEAIKAQEKSRTRASSERPANGRASANEALNAEADSAVPASTGRELPGLMRALKLQVKAARAGFDWREARGVFAKLREEIDELEAEAFPDPADAAALSDEERVRRQEAELGDVLFSVVNVARHLKLDSETCLHQANEKFLRRFHAMEAIAQSENRDFKNLGEADLDALWEAARRQLSRP